VALSSAVPRPPLVAAGRIGAAQINALERVLARPELAGRTVVLAIHHPPVHRWSRWKERVEGLHDAAALLAALRPVTQGLILHGHLHRRLQRIVATADGKIHQLGATSASLHHESLDRMAGFNLYEVTQAGLTRAEALVYSPSTRSFRVESIPRHV
jgi:3',5'-cyclic AMP phosphodiesterase CpdA